MDLQDSKRDSSKIGETTHLCRFGPKDCGQDSCSLGVDRYVRNSKTNSKIATGITQERMNSNIYRIVSIDRARMAEIKLRIGTNWVQLRIFREVGEPNYDNLRNYTVIHKSVRHFKIP